MNELDPNETRNSYNQLLSLQAASAPVANPLLAPVPAAAPQAFPPTLTNQNAALGSMMSQQVQDTATASLTLPTRRGIKTAFHTGGLPNLQGGTVVTAGNNFQQQQQRAQQQAFEHVAKRMKAGETMQQTAQIQINAPVTMASTVQTNPPLTLPVM